MYVGCRAPPVRVTVALIVDRPWTAVALLAAPLATFRHAVLRGASDGT